jgi:prepilin-type N-terminal cleavage/methylation domain-containing protein
VSVSRRDDGDARRSDEGFTLIEMMITVLVLMIVSGTVMKGVLDLTNLHNTIMNRTDMHSGVRNATELLTQEVGQAGRIALPAPVTLTADPALAAVSLNVTSTTGMFIGEQLNIDTGALQETATVTAVVSGTQISVSTLTKDHPNAAPVKASGGFAAGVVPAAVANGSTGALLKIFGDINGDGNMVYVEYTCDTAAGRLYRNSMPFNAGAKPAITVEQILIDNILPNPDATPCFTYQTQTINGTTYVLDVAITLTVRTQNRDLNTGQFMTETKALLNVSPRNVFNVWQLAGLGVTNRVQPIPPTVQALLP